MSYSVWEMVDSMSGSVTNDLEQGETREVRRRFVIGRCERGFNEVVTEIAPYAPRYVNSDGAGLYWVRQRLDVNGIGNAYFDCTATYQTLVPKLGEDGDPEDGDFVPGSIAWDTTGHTEHITQGIPGTEVRIPEGAPSYSGALNVSGDSVQGLDVVRPNLRYSETWILPLATAMNCEFVSTVYTLTGSVNQDQFRCFEPGTALFMGGRAQWNGDQPYVTVTFDWEARPNENGIYPWDGAGATFDKKGWEHVWIRYAPAVAGNSVIRTPVAAYKNQVFPTKSWNDLGIIAKGIGNGQLGALGQQPAQGGAGPA